MSSPLPPALLRAQKLPSGCAGRLGRRRFARPPVLADGLTVALVCALAPAEADGDVGEAAAAAAAGPGTAT
jgi:hypothetical protein